MRILGIGGEPATGKSTLVGELMRGMGDLPERFVWGQLQGFWFKTAKTYVISEDLAIGIDSSAEEFMQYLSKTDPLARIIFSGDRLFTGKFIEACLRIVAASDAMFLVLVADDEVKAARLKQRQDFYSDSWIKGRVTKYKNLCIDYPHRIVAAPHHITCDTERLLRRCHEFLRASNGLSATTEKAISA